MSEAVIKLEGVSKYYKLYDHPKDRLKEALHPFGRAYHKKFYAVSDFSLEVMHGEILGILGKNGSGKSTLLKLISGVLTPDKGSVYVKGKITALLELGSGFNPEFTGIDNVYFYGTIMGVSRSEMDKKIDDILAFAEIGDFIYQPLKTYSSGMRSRLGFAVAVHLEPDILILDEVLSVGDALFRRKCHARMQEFFNSGKTIIYVSHDANSITSLCTRAIFIHEGVSLLDTDAKTATMMYQKYLFADDNNKQKLIGELKSNHAAINKQGGINEDDMNAGSKKDSYFIEGFVPKSTVRNKNYNVNINDCRLLNDDGEPVNVLSIGDTYTFHCVVEFHEDFQLVKFGCYMKNEKGLVLTGLTMPSKKTPIDKVVSGEEYVVNAKFRCELSPGNYYMDIGVTSDINSEKVYLNVIHDALVFKVQQSECDYWGMVNLWDKFSVQRKELVNKS